MNAPQRPDAGKAAQDDGGRKKRPTDPDATLATNLNRPAEPAPAADSDFEGTLFGPVQVQAEMQRAKQTTDHKPFPPGGLRQAALRREDFTAATIANSPSPATLPTLAGERGTMVVGPPASDQPDLQSGAMWGDFALGDLLGKGGMGSVFKGRQVSLDRSVAIKVLPSELGQNESFRKRFLLEAKAVAQISSPHVVQVYAAGEHKGHQYFVMEYVDGKDLARRLKEGLRPTKKQALDYVWQAARGLAAAGEMGIIHRDIKPGNMMLTERGELKLMDFGLVKLARENTAATGLTMAGTVMGTVSYFSPEQGRGESCDQRTDIYALGVVFYELLTGCLPFTGGDATSVIYQHIHTEPRLPKEIDPTIPEDYQAIVLKCMQKAPENRYQSAAELCKDLELVSSGQSPRTAWFDPRQLRTGATLTRTAQFGRERRRGNRAPLVLLVAVALAAGAYVTWKQGWLPLGEKPEPSIRPRPTPISAPVYVPAPVDQTGEDLTPRIAILEREGQEALARGEVDLARMRSADIVKLAPGHPAAQRIQGALDIIAVVRDGISAAKQALGEGQPAQARTRLKDLDKLLKQATRDDRAEVDRLCNVCSAMETFLQTGTNALAAGDLTGARQAFGDSIKEWANAPAQKGLQAVGLCERVKRAIGDGDATVAAQALGELEAAKLDQRIVDAYRNDLRRLELVRAVEAALQRRDFPAADEKLTALRQTASGNREVEQLGHRVELERRLAAFDRSLAERNLEEARRRLDAIREHAGEGQAFRDAQSRLQASRLEEDEKGRVAQARDKVAQEAALSIRQKLAAPDPDLAACEHAIAAFAQNHGAERSENADLRKALETRRKELAVAGLCARLDQAVLAGDAAVIDTLVLGANHAQALKGLIGSPELVLKHTLAALRHEEGAMVAEISLKTAMRAFPETQVAYRYRLEQRDGAWKIVTVMPVAQAP